MMKTPIATLIDQLDATQLSIERITVLKPLIHFIDQQIGTEKSINLNFICTHNSRRSILSQVWAKTMAEYFDIKNVYTYSGGTEAMAVFPKVLETLEQQGFEVLNLSAGTNRISAVKYDDNALPVLAFSKTYDDAYNPRSNFGAVLTCESASQNCPAVVGALARIPITYDDPKVSDGTHEMDHIYTERSLQIATELKYVFSQVSKF